MNELDKGKILIAGLSTDLGSHAVNIYGYTEDEDGTVRFKTYDNNYGPMDGLEIVITPETSTYGHKETYNFTLETPGYTLTSVGSEKYRFVVMDEDLNFIVGEEIQTVKEVNYDDIY